VLVNRLAIFLTEILARFKFFCFFFTTLSRSRNKLHPSAPLSVKHFAVCLSFSAVIFCMLSYAQGDADVISIHIYASWFSPRHLVGITLRNVCDCDVA